MISTAPRLKLIQKIGVGVNTIDLDAAKARFIPVCNLPGTNARAVAELTLALMLATLRRVPRFHAELRAGTWLNPALQDGIGDTMHVPAARGAHGIATTHIRGEQRAARRVGGGDVASRVLANERVEAKRHPQERVA